MEVKPGYKQTEVGVIPEKWNVKPFGEIFAFRNGVNADKEAYGEGVRFINVLEPITYSHILGPEIKGQVKLPESVTASYAVRRGDVLFNRTSETESEIGLAATYLGTERVVFGGFVIRGRPISDDFDPVYSGYALRAPHIRSQIIPMGQGAIRANIGQDNLSRVIAPIPPPPEQRAIAAALSDVDGLLGGLDRLVAKKRDLKQSAMQQLLTGQTRLSGFEKQKGYKQTEVGVIPNDWGITPMREFGKFAKGIGLLKEDIGSAGRIPAIPYTSLYTDFSEIIDYDKIKWFVDDPWETNVVCEPCVLIASSSNMAANTGKACALAGNIPVAVGREVIIFRTQADCRFVSYLLSTPPYRRRTLTLARGTTIKHLYPATFQDYKIAFPSVPEQTAIAEVLTEMDAELAALEQRREKTHALKQAMMQELLTGKTRLISPQNAAA